MQDELPEGYTLGGDGMRFIGRNATGCASSDEISGTSACFLMVTTNPENLIGLAKEASMITVNVALSNGATAYSVSTDADFVTLSATSGTGDGSFTISYEVNGDAAPREAVVTLSSTVNTINLELDLRLIQLGTAAAIVGDVVLDSAEAITGTTPRAREVREARYILGSLSVGDVPDGTDIANSHLQSLLLEGLQET